MTRYWHQPGWKLSKGGSWADHVRRGSPGGEDFPLGHRTAVFAPASGWLSFHRASERPNRIHGAAGWDGAGQVLLLTRTDGVEFTLFHASAGEGVTLGGEPRWVREGDRAGKSGGRRGTPSQGLSTGPHSHEHAVVNGRRVPISSLMTDTAGGGVAPFPEPKKPRKRKNMTQVLITTFRQGLPDADPRVAKIKGYLGGDGVKNFSSGVSVIALVGDSPGTPANVQVTQSDSRGNEWAADHSGSWGNIQQAARRYELDEFLALCDAYLTRSPVDTTGVGLATPE